MRCSRRLVGTAFAAALVVAGAGLSGCADGMDDSAVAPNLETQVPDIRGSEELDDPYRGVLDARFVEDLPAYQEQQVTVLAAVAEVLSPRSFTVTSPDGSDVEPVLVITTEEAAGVQPQAGDDVVIAATPVGEFDAEVVEEELGTMLPGERYEEWDGETFLVATIIEPAP